MWGLKAFMFTDSISSSSSFHIHPNLIPDVMIIEWPGEINTQYNNTCGLPELPHAITNNDSYSVNVQLLTLDCDGSYCGTECCQSICLSTPSHTNNECQHTHFPLASFHCNKHKLSISVSLQYIT